MALPRVPTRTFIAQNLVVWVVMVVILVLVPDALERWLPVELSRFVAWAIACAVWVVSVERHWQARFGTLSRFFLQLGLWVAAAVVAIWISEMARTPDLSP